ncbi:MAG: radical SAM protein [Candidatus Omnitrophota bacterium]
MKKLTKKILEQRRDFSLSLLEKCSICPRRCGVNRLKGDRGFCRVGRLPIVYSYAPHFGEEPPISGTYGSGTIFFSHCNLKCVYCQNYKFSQLDKGKEISINVLADYMIELQRQGCHNINFVTPTHFMPQILEALVLAIDAGLKIPLVYNTSGYELEDVIKLLDGVIDIYLVDMRYADKDQSIKYSSAPDYPKHNQESVIEMYKQVGVVKFNKNDVMQKGMIIRHLVLPDNVSGTYEIMRFITKKVSKDIHISLMSQYTPYYKAMNYSQINRRINSVEYEDAKRIMQECDLDNGWIQDDYGLDHLAGIHIKPKKTIY